jgi:flagellar hook-associated protein 1 FlgK
MGSLFTGLNIASNALDAFQHAINVTSTNVTNASTPGYARQQVVLTANSFDAYTAVGGGVGFSGTVDSRDEYAERSVRQSVSQQGEATERAQDYTRLEQILPVDGASGISASLDSFFQAFSSLTTAPNDATARQLALDQAQQVAQSFQQASEALDQAKQGTQQDLTNQVNQINTIAANIVSINKQFEQNVDATTDPGLNAQLSQSLEQLSQYADLTVLKQDNGTVMVYAGQSLLVAGDRSMPLQWASGAGQRVLEDSRGNDVSTTLRSGSLSALLDQMNHVEPGLESNLNRLAQSFATAVNSALQAGVDQSNNSSHPSWHSPTRRLPAGTPSPSRSLICSKPALWAAPRSLSFTETWRLSWGRWPPTQPMTRQRRKASRPRRSRCAATCRVSASTRRR